MKNTSSLHMRLWNIESAFKKAMVDVLDYIDNEFDEEDIKNNAETSSYLLLASTLCVKIDETVNHLENITSDMRDRELKRQNNK